VADHVYAKLVRAKLRAQMAYPLSFALDCLSQVLVQTIELCVILVLFNRITALGGFSVDEVLLVYGLASCAFGLTDTVVGQLDHLPTYLRKGTLDVLLLRPLRVLPQIVVSDIRLRRLGRVLTGLVVLVFALWRNDIAWSPWTAALAVAAPVTGAVIFGAVWVAAGAVTFWLIDGQEFSSSVTYGSNAFTSYPINIYGPWLRRFMAFVVPGAFVAYYPALALLDRPDPLGGPAWLGWISPLVAAAATGVAALAWRTAVRHYQGTGS
jgi:ABC-2 type transport system permease protein